MIDQKRFLSALEQNGITFFTGVPDSLLNDFCNCVRENIPAERHVIAANEGNAIALAAGYSFGHDCIPLVYMQNSGMGNALNPLVSLADSNVYGVPMVLLIGWRGDPTVSDWAQHKTQGEITTGLLDLMKIPYRIVYDENEKIEETAAWAAETAKKLSAPVALVAKKNVFSGTKSPIRDSSFPLSREEAMAVVLDTAPKNTVYSATTGRAARELHALRDLRGESHAFDFLNVGSMGHASSVATGMALACPERPVICFDGDAAAIMHMGSWTTDGKMGLSNLLHIVLNNGVHESVGGQPSAGRIADFTAMAKACGYAVVDYPVNDAESLTRAVRELLAADRPGFIDAQIHAGLRPGLAPLRVDHNEVIEALRAELRGAKKG